MRITHELYHNGPASTLDMPEAKMERRSMDLRAARNPSLSGQFETSDPHVAPYSTGTGAARGPMARAISRLAACVLDGLEAGVRTDRHPTIAEPLLNHLGALEIAFSDDQVGRLNAVSEVDMGFPHSMLNSGVTDQMFGGVRVETRAR